MKLWASGKLLACGEMVSPDPTLTKSSTSKLELLFFTFPFDHQLEILRRLALFY